MRLGLFMMPSHPPERSIADGHQWDLQVLRWADEYNFEEAWIGEHYTITWEPNPSPDLLIAQALMQTKRIRLGTGGFILSYHHPVELAHRVMFLDHISGGRFNFGMASGAMGQDMTIFNADRPSNREKLREAIEIILLYYSDKDTFEYRGKYWDANLPIMAEGHRKMVPFQKPHPPMALTGAFSVKSETLMLAGEYGFTPMSFNMAVKHTANHWNSVVEGAAITGRNPHRSSWGVVREVFVADTDEEARRHAVDGMMGRVFGTYMLPMFKKIKLAHFFSDDPKIDYTDLNLNYLAKNNWIVGSPATVTERLEKLYDDLGGFGTLLVHGFDYSENPAAWKRSMELLGTEVMPRLRHLNGGKQERRLEATA